MLPQVALIAQVPHHLLTLPSFSPMPIDYTLFPGFPPLCDSQLCVCQELLAFTRELRNAPVTSAWCKSTETRCGDSVTHFPPSKSPMAEPTYTRLQMWSLFCCRWLKSFNILRITLSTVCMNLKQQADKWLSFPQLCFQTGQTISSPTLNLTGSRTCWKWRDDDAVSLWLSLIRVCSNGKIESFGWCYTHKYCTGSPRFHGKLLHKKK